MTLICCLLFKKNAGGRTRTGTPLRTQDFESSTSTNSITPAVNVNLELIHNKTFLNSQ